MEVRPSKRYIKHGVVYPPEKYNQNIHNTADDIDDRNINYNTNPPSSYYTSSEIELMKTQIKQAKCPICLQPINDDTCRVCSNGHKFHNKCDKEQSREVSECPECRDKKITMCKGNYNDLYSGGKYSKKRKNKKGKKTKKNIRNRKHRKYKTKKTKQYRRRK